MSQHKLSNTRSKYLDTQRAAVVEAMKVMYMLDAPEKDILFMAFKEHTVGRSIAKI